jgi:hypothetical protein
VDSGGSYPKPHIFAAKALLSSLTIGAAQTGAASAISVIGI